MYSILSFKCSECENEIKEEIFVPDTNMEDNDGSFSEQSLECSTCGKVHDLNVNNRGGIVLVTVDGVPLETSSASTPYTESQHLATEEEEQWREEYDWYQSITQQTVYQYFTSSIDSLKEMLTITIKDRQQSEVFNRMLLVQAIAGMEAYLSDTFISRTVTDSSLLKKLFEIDKYLSRERYSISEFLDDEDLPKKIAKTYLSDLIYHNLPKVGVLYKKVLEVQFDYGDKRKKEDLFRAIQARHDCVHRNGKTKDEGDIKLIDKKYILKTITNIEQFVSKIEKTLEEYDDIPF